MLIFPIGMIFYYNERKSKGSYQAVFDDYIDKVDQSEEFSKREKIARVEKLFLANRYDIVLKTEDEIVAERKIFSMGLFMMGLFFYLLYYFFFQKPHYIGYKIK
jgi:ribonucleotide reductase beta subunit family protein with ferritin-like domain